MLLSGAIVFVWKTLVNFRVNYVNVTGEYFRFPERLKLSEVEASWDKSQS